MNASKRPEGYSTVTPNLCLKDTSRAIDFYKRAFGAKELGRFDRPDGKVMHAELKIGDSMFMVGEEAPEKGCLSPQSLKGTPVNFYIYVDDADAAFKKALDAGAKSKGKVEDMPWGDRVGELTDPFGQSWTVAQHKEDLTREQIRDRLAQFAHA